MFFFSSLCDLFCVILFLFFFLMIRRPPRSTRTDTLFPYTTLFRSSSVITLLSYNRNGTAYVTVNHDALDHRWLIGGVEKARLLAATGDLLVGKTTTAAGAGARISPDGYVHGTVAGGAAGYFDRLTSDGAVVTFRRQSIDVGSISVTATAKIGRADV